MTGLVHLVVLGSFTWVGVRTIIVLTRAATNLAAAVTTLEWSFTMASKLTAANARKAIVAGVGLVATVANLGLVHGTAETVLQVIIAAATAAGVYTVPNRVGPAPARPTSVL